MNQKYKLPEQMMADYPQAYNAYLNSHLPPTSRQLEQFGVRSADAAHRAPVQPA